MHDAGYCWRPEWVYPFESLRSLLSKFMLLNHIGITDLNQVFCYKSPSSFRISLLNGNRALLNSSIFNNCIDPSLLKEVLGLSDEQLTFSVIESYTYYESYWRNEFRFCPSCLEAGYHSPFHQHKMFNKCPIHGDKLKTCCMKCNAVLPYEFSRLTVRNPYECTECGHIHIISGHRVENELVNKIAEIADFLKRKQSRACIFEKRLSRVDIGPIDGSKSYLYGIHKYYNKLVTNHWRSYEREQLMTPARWSDEFGKNMGGLSKSGIARNETFKTLEFRCQNTKADKQALGMFDILKPSDNFNDSKLEPYSFRAIYKSIKRHLRNKYLKPAGQISQLNSYYSSNGYTQHSDAVPDNDARSVLATAYIKLCGHYDSFMVEAAADERAYKKLLSKLKELHPYLCNFVVQHDTPSFCIYQIINHILADECRSAYIEFLMRSIVQFKHIVQRKHEQTPSRVFERDRRYDSHWLICTSQPGMIKLHLWSTKLDLPKIYSYIQRHSRII